MHDATRHRTLKNSPWLATVIWVFFVSLVSGAPPQPVFNQVFPPGGEVGTTVPVKIFGNHLTAPIQLVFGHPGLRAEMIAADQFRVSIPADISPGQYDLQIVTANGISGVRTFVIGNRPECLEVEQNNLVHDAQPVSIPIVINGKIDKGDLDQFRFTARSGQRVILECVAERIDSKIRAVLELYDQTGHRVSVNRGEIGLDPRIDFLVPQDGEYVVKLSDLVYSGSNDHYYRLEIDTGPRIAYAEPCVVEQGKTSKIALYGWNLLNSKGGFPGAESNSGSANPMGNERSLDRITVEVTPPLVTNTSASRRSSNQVGLNGFDYYYPGANAPLLLGLTDVPVYQISEGNETPESAYDVSIPSETSGRLLAGDEQDWFAVQVRKGEVLWFEAIGERLNSPVDLDLAVFDPAGRSPLVSFHDTPSIYQASRFNAGHTDPIGRWIAPADGRHLVALRNVIGDTEKNPRRQYRLSIRREEPGFDLIAIPRSDVPAGINIERGGTCAIDIMAYRQRGFSGAIRVSAKNLPAGIECPDFWIGPDVPSAPLVIAAARGIGPLATQLNLVGYAEGVGTRPVRGGAVVHQTVRGVQSRIIPQLNYKVTGDSQIRLVANGIDTRLHQLYGKLKVRHSPGSIIDVEVNVERMFPEHRAPVKLIGTGLPDLILNQTAEIPSGHDQETISFYLPPTLPAGQYSLAIQGQTTVPTGPADSKGNLTLQTVNVISNTVSFDIQPAAFQVQIDPFAPKRIRRGEVIQIQYSAKRMNGFIGKIHTELDAPGDVRGLRGRGVTFVGQTDSGSIQVVASDDAPLGLQPFLRLLGVGVLEDQPIFQSSCFLNLEIME